MYKPFKKLRDLIEMYDFFISQKVRTGFFYEKPSFDSWILDYKHINTPNNVSVLFSIDTFARVIPYRFMQEIRDHFEDQMGKHIRINYWTHSNGYVIDWDSPAMKMKRQVWNTKDKERSEEDLNAFNMSEKIEDLDDSHWLKETLKDFVYAIFRKKRVTLSNIFIIQVLCENVTKAGLSEFYDFVEHFETTVRQMGVFISQLSYELTDVLKNYMPLSFSTNVRKNVMLTRTVWTDELLAKALELRQGIVGERGIYVATDLYSEEAIFKQYKKTDVDAEITLITAETCGGKGVVIKTQITQLLATDIRGLIDDVEGDEYTPIADWCNIENPEYARVVDLRRGGFIDPVPIVDYEPISDEKLRATLKDQAIHYTELELRILIGRKLIESDTWVEDILSASVAEYYRSLGVTDDMDTWKHSKSGSIRDFLSLYEKAVKENYVFEDIDGLIELDVYKQIVRKMCSKLKKYFSPRGTGSSYFTKPLNLDELNNANLVILAYHMKNTTTETLDPVQVELMMATSAIMSYQRSIYCKYVLGKFNFKVKDEFQRWQEYPNGDKIAGTEVTGGRKLGDIIIISTNSIGKMLYANSPAIIDIFSNITSIMIGAIRDQQIRRDLLKRLSAEHLKDELDYISVDTLAKDKTNSDSPYKFAFIVGMNRSDYTVGKVNLPKSLRESALFKTGVTRKE